LLEFVDIAKGELTFEKANTGSLGCDGFFWYIGIYYSNLYGEI